jgi:hypothetical protein
MYAKGGVHGHYSLQSNLEEWETNQSTDISQVKG